MEPRIYLSDAVPSPPEAPAVPSVGFPTNGSDIGAQSATSPGAYWFYQVGESLRRIIVAAGNTPSDANLDLLMDSIVALNAVNQLPIGALLIMDGDVVPTGFLKRNGAELLRASYPKLWAYAQTVSNFISQATKDADPENYAGYYGDGDGSTTFTIPDWRGEHWRAWDDGRGVDIGRTIGSWQAHAIENMTGSIPDLINMSNIFGESVPTGVFTATDVNTASTNITGGSGGDKAFTMNFDASGQVNTDVETRPRNLSGMALVRAY